MRDVAYIALGSNLGDREGALARARVAIDALPESYVIAATVIEETAPIGPINQGPFLNQMLALDTELDPEALLEALLDIERTEGRERTVRWGPRTLDLDIVAFEHTQWRSERLTIPHRELPNRDFWQRELAELRSAIDE
jgi:2-amino-4-hydroxy-6-hydroxymethyldihydropteridine diphosphokinase